jgi:hypothetical protein
MKINLFKKLAVLSLLGLGIGGLVSCNPTGETVVEVKTGTVDLKFESSQGTVTASKKEGNVGDTITLTVTPAEGYHVVSVTANGTALTGPNYAFELQEGTNVVRAEFAKDPTIALAANAQAFKAHLTYELTATVADAPVQNYVVKFTHNAGDNLTGTTEGNKFTFKATATGSYKIQAGAYENAQATTAFATATFDLTVAQGQETYNLVLDTTNVKKEYKQGEKFTAAGLGVKKEFKVDGTKVSESDLSASEVTFDIPEGTEFTEVKDVEITVSDVEEVATPAKFTVTVGADYLWQLKQTFKQFATEGYENLVVSGGKLYDTSFVAPNAFIDLAVGQAFVSEQVTQSGNTLDVVGKYDFEIADDEAGTVSATYRNYARNAYSNTGVYAKDYAKGYKNLGLFVDYDEATIDQIFTGLTYDETEKEDYTGLV